MKKLLFCLAFLLCAFTPSFAAEVSVPAKVSQGHAFPVSVLDSRPFTAVFRWRGEALKVKAVKSGPCWQAEILLAMPIDAVKEQVLSIELPTEQQDIIIEVIRSCFA